MRPLQFVMMLIALYLAVFVLRGILSARTFPQVHDAAIMRYVTFMIDRSHAPYTWMVEMNLPGTLMTEWFSLHLFGDGAAGLWRWDTAIGLVAVAAAAWTAGREYRFAAMAGALLAWLLHQSNGARDFAQRDWFLAALLMVAAGCLAAGMRRHNAAWTAPAVGLAAWAAAIKPYAALFAIALFLVALMKLKGQRLRVTAWSAAGVALPVLGVFLYFAHWPGSFTAFLQTERTLGAWYTHLDEAPFVSMITQVLPVAVFVVFVLAVYLWVREKFWTYPGDLLFFTGFLCCAAMYLAQRKGFMYQTYPMAMFGFAGAFAVAQRSLQRSRDQRLVAVALMMAALWTLPLRFYREQRTELYASESQESLVRDLQRLGGERLSGNVQCLDMTMGGCIGALAALHLEQTTGFVNDHTLFPQVPQPFLADLQQRFLREVSANPPRVIVLSAHNWPDEEDRSFSKLARWPAFAEFLARGYNLHGTFQPGASSQAAGYRIYVRQ